MISHASVVQSTLTGSSIPNALRTMASVIEAQRHANPRDVATYLARCADTLSSASARITDAITNPPEGDAQVDEASLRALVDFEGDNDDDEG